MPSPKTLLGLHVASLASSLCVLVLSGFDMGVFSCWCAPSFGAVTFLYHIAVFLFTYFRPDKRSLTSTVSMTAAYILSVCWLVTFVIMIVVRGAHVQTIGPYLKFAGFYIHIPKEHGSQKWRFLMIPVLWVLLGDLGVRTMVCRQRLLEEEAEERLPVYNDDVTNLTQYAGALRP